MGNRKREIWGQLSTGLPPGFRACLCTLHPGHLLPIRGLCRGHQSALRIEPELELGLELGLTATSFVPERRVQNAECRVNRDLIRVEAQVQDVRLRRNTLARRSAKVLHSAKQKNK